jgi:hypothetical protein
MAGRREEEAAAAARRRQARRAVDDGDDDDNNKDDDGDAEDGLAAGQRVLPPSAEAAVAHEQRLKALVHYAVGRIVDESSACVSE